MSFRCQQVKTDYEQLQALKDQFILAYEKAKETKSLGKARALKNKWEQQYDSLRKNIGEFLPGEVYDFIMELREKTNEDIQNGYDFHFQLNGDLAGKVMVGEEWYPFHGNEIIKIIAEEEIEFCDYIHTRPNGDLAGQIEVGRN